MKGENKMTHEEYKLMLMRKLHDLRKQGKNPHGELRDALIDLQLTEPEWFEAHQLL